MPSILSVTLVCALAAAACGVLRVVLRTFWLRHAAFPAAVIAAAFLGIWWSEEDGNLYLLAAAIAAIACQAYALGGALAGKVASRARS